MSHAFQRNLTAKYILEKQEADKVYPLSSAAVVTRKASSASTSSAASSGLRRPASVVIHDNEELLRLADELLSQEMALEERPQPSSPATNLVRRNSSGYSSSGSRDRLSKTPQSASKWPPPPPVSSAKVSQVPKSATNGPAPARPPQSPIRSRSYKGATSTVLNRVKAAESNLDPRRSSMCGAAGEFRPRSSGTLTRESATGKGVLKKDQVQLPEKAAKGMRRQKSHDASEAKRAAFLQNRSSTGLNLFGLGHKRRSSVAVRAAAAEDDVRSGMRPAKSSANILQQLGSPSPSKKKTGQTVGLSRCLGKRTRAIGGIKT